MKRYLIVLLMLLFLTSGYVFAEEIVAENNKFVYDDEGKRDPFWPLVSANGSMITYGETDLLASDMVLTGVMTGSDGTNIAIINGKIVKEGDMIGAFYVKKIMPTFVVLDNGKEKSELHLRKEE